MISYYGTLLIFNYLRAIQQLNSRRKKERKIVRGSQVNDDPDFVATKTTFQMAKLSYGMMSISWVKRYSIGKKRRLNADHTTRFDCGLNLIIISCIQNLLLRNYSKIQPKTGVVVEQNVMTNNFLETNSHDPDYVLVLRVLLDSISRILVQKESILII